MGKIIPQSIKDEIVRRYQSEEIGMLCLAREFGVNLMSVSNWLHRANVKVRRRGLKVGCIDHANQIHGMPIIHRRYYESQGV